MNKQNTIFKKKELVLAVSVAMFSGSMVGCSSDNTSAGGGEYTVTAKGGNALNSDNLNEAGLGGYGGRVDIENEGGTGGVEILSSGKANASFSSIITTPNENLGDTPLEVTSDTTLVAVDNWTNATQYADATVAATHSLSTSQVYLDTNNVLRTFTGVTGVDPIDYSADTPVSDDHYYATSGGELYHALGDDGAADLAAAGMPYTISQYSPRSILVADGIEDGDNDTVTGLSVASDAILTLEMNGYGGAVIEMENDIVNDGTITTTNLNNRDDLRLMTDGSYIASGDIDTSGADNGYGGRGGDIQIMAGGIYNSGNMNSSGVAGGDAGDINGYGGFIENSGTLTANGGDLTSGTGGSGGDAGAVSIRAAYLENSGAISSNGGAADAAGYGGDGDAIRLYGAFGVNNSADISSNGAIGGYGGDGAEIRLDAKELGSVRNSGNLSANGADGSDGFAGYGGNIKLYADGGEIISSGDLVARGGNSSSNHPGSYDAGRGGRIDIMSDDTNVGYGGLNIAQQAGSIILSGNLDVSGGDNLAADSSGYGGYGGRIDIFLDQDEDLSSPVMTITDAKVSLLGYTGIDVSGGDGGQGGFAGDIYLTSDHQSFSGSDLGGGPVVNQVDLAARGGNAIVVAGVTTNAQGGYGGYINIETNGDANSDILTVSNNGDIDVSGGTGYNGDSGIGGYGGYGGLLFIGGAGGAGMSGDVYMAGHFGVTNRGELTLNGGDDLGDTSASRGGFSLDVDMFASFGPVINSGTIVANGGSGAMMGGNSASTITFAGLTVNNSGNISHNGGDADPAVIGSMGGNGGDIEVYAVSIKSSDTNNSGTLSATGGTGETTGEDGCTMVGLTEVMVGCSGTSKP